MESVRRRILVCISYVDNVHDIVDRRSLRIEWNGVVEKFNDHYRQKFIDKVTMSSMPQLRQELLAFEHRHNNTYRYSKIKGKTPRRALIGTEKKLVFPSKGDVPGYPPDKSEEGRYHLVRFIRSDCRLNILH